MTRPADPAGSSDGVRTPPDPPLPVPAKQALQNVTGDLQTDPMSESIDVHQVDDTTWVVRDPAFTRDDPRHTIACMAQSAGGHVEVIWLLSGRTSTYPSLRSALDAVRHERRPQTRPFAIPHLPPVRGRGSGRSRTHRQGRRSD